MVTGKDLEVHIVISVPILVKLIMSALILASLALGLLLGRIIWGPA